MGKLALWIFVAVAVMLLIRLFGPGKRRMRDELDEPDPPASKRPEAGDPQSRGKPGELMMSCAVCGVHLPSSDAVFARGKVYCGIDHRDQERAE